MHRRLVPILLAALTLLTAACSGSDNEKALTEATLQGYLLTADDLPAGFTESEPEEEEEDEEDQSSCTGRDIDETVPPSASASVEFTGGGGATQLSHDVDSYEEGKAEQAMAEGRKLVERCKTFEEPLDDTTIRGTMSVSDAPDLGDEAVAFSIRAAVAEIDLYGELIAVRQGELITAVSLFNAGGPPSREQVLESIRRAVERLPN